MSSFLAGSELCLQKCSSCSGAALSGLCWEVLTLRTCGTSLHCIVDVVSLAVPLGEHSERSSLALAPWLPEAFRACIVEFQKRELAVGRYRELVERVGLSRATFGSDFGLQTILSSLGRFLSRKGVRTQLLASTAGFGLSVNHCTEGSDIAVNSFVVCAFASLGSR